MKPRIYIVVLNYNGLNDTVHCLNSLKKINYRNFRIVVVDNGSKNNEAKVLKKRFPKLAKIIALDNNKGFAQGNNIGIKEALKDNPEYVVLLNNDTIVEENFINGLLKPFLERKNVGITTSKIFYYHQPEKIWYAGANFNKFTGESRHWGINESDSQRYSNILEIDRASGCSMMIKRGVFERIGLLDEKYFLLFEESDFCLRAKKNGFKIFFSPESKVWHKVSQATGANSSEYIYYYKRNHLYFTKKFFSSIHWFIFLFYSFVISNIFTGYWLFFTRRNRFNRVKMLFFAYKDFFSNRMFKQKP